MFNYSGTLTNIFNNFEGARTFSDVVAEAKEAGYIEPERYFFPPIKIFHSSFKKVTRLSFPKT
jgi:hypothetical protein